MSNIRPLSPDQAKRSLIARLGARADRLRNLSTKLGLRPYRVFLIWTKFSGDERGEGRETEVRRLEILPVPVVDSLDNLTYSQTGAGVIPEGSVCVSKISPQLAFDTLTGKIVPQAHELTIPEPYDFFWEIVADGRDDTQPIRQRFRLMGEPSRRAGKLMWEVRLQKTDGDRTRAGESTRGEP